MYFTFRKEIVENRLMPGYGRLEWCSMYTVTFGQSTIGRFFHSDEVAFIGFDEEDIRIDYIRKFLRTTTYTITNQKNNQVIGTYKPWKTGYLPPFYRLTLHEDAYLCSRMENAPPHKKQQQYFTIRINNALEAVTYRFYVPPGRFFTLSPSSIDHRPFAGEIEQTGDNRLLLLTGLFLIQQALDYTAREG